MRLRLSREQRRGLWWWLAVLPAGLVPLYLLLFVIRGTKMQFGDYFYMLSSIFAPDGRFTPSGLLVHANEHLIAIPKVVYAINVRAFGGSNISLGIFVWLISLLILLMLWVNVRGTLPRRSASAAALVWLVTVTAFPVQALHNFVFGMSGSAWILANAFVVLAIHLAVRGRSIEAGVAGTLATFSYGTGLAVWPALVILVAVRRTRVSWRDGIMLLLGVVAVSVERWTGDMIFGHPGPAYNPLTVVRSLAIASGSLFTQSAEIAVILGVVVLTALVYAVGVLLPDHLQRGQTFILGVAVYGLVALILVAVARGSFGDETLTAGRYMTLAALLASGTAMLGLFVWTDRRRWLVTVGGGIVLALTAAGPTIEHFEGVVVEQDVAAVAARLGVADNDFLRGYEAQSGALLEALGNYPFNSSFRADCGLLGQTVTGRLLTDSEQVQGTIDNISVSANPQAVNVSGWAYSSRSAVQCVLLLDDRGYVIGAGVYGTERLDVRAVKRLPETNVGWVGVAQRRPEADVRAAVVLRGSESVYLLGEGNPIEVP